MKTWRCKWRKGEALRAVGNEGIQEWAKLLKYTGRFLMPWKWRLLNWTSNKVPVKICQQSILRNHDCWSILASHLSANFFSIHGRLFIFSPKVLKWWRGEKSLQNYGLVMMQHSPWRMKNSCTSLIFSISRGLGRSREWWLFWMTWYVNSSRPSPYYIFHFVQWCCKLKIKSKSDKIDGDKGQIGKFSIIGEVFSNFIVGSRSIGRSLKVSKKS